jgi:GNAT superfamily N-acetyltransferase
MPDYEPHALHIRPMTVADVPAGHALSIALGWTHRLEDWAMLQRCAEGFVAEQDGKVIGTAFACHQGAFSTIGLVIVSAACQGQGIGRQLMNRVLEATGPRTALLNATVEGAWLYSRMGFSTLGQVEQWQGPAPVLAVADERCRTLTPADTPRLVALATAGSGLDRQILLDDLLPRVVHGVGLDQGGHLHAFALLRPFGRGLGLGPVIAQNVDQAKALIQTLLHTVPGQFVRVDIPSGCGLAPWLEQQGLAHVDTVTQMTTGPIPQPQEGVYQFGLISQAVG